MKKAFLFALVALCVSAAQAVTVKWSGNTGINCVTLDQGTSNKSYSVAMVLSGISGTANYLEFANQTSSTWKENDRYFFRSNNNNLFVGNKSNANTALGTTTPIVSGNTYVCVLNIAAKGESDYTLEFYVNSNKVYTYDYNDVTAIALWGKAKEATIYNGTLTTEQIEYLTQKQTATVPEPTALALLALGVAGLALKRKVA